jgi:uncharacterized membrane protein
MEKTEIEWCFHPFQRDYRTSAGVVIFLVALCILVYVVFNEVLLAVLTALVLLVSLWEFFLPSRYRLTADGLTVRTVSGIIERSWSEFTGFSVGRAGILLRIGAPGALRFIRRGEVRVFFPEGEEEQKQQVIELVKAKVEQAHDKNGRENLDGYD